jgi:hypothetical protein
VIGCENDGRGEVEVKNQEMRDRNISYMLLRVLLGVNIALQGISRLLRSSNFAEEIEAHFAHFPLPHPAVAALALALPWAESLIGLLILVGLWTGSLADRRSIAYDCFYIWFLPHSGLPRWRYTRNENLQDPRFG